MTERITPDYLRLNMQLHASDPDYGTSGRRWTTEIRRLQRRYGFASILDYGAGKCELSTRLPDLHIRCYDPAVPGIDDEPEPAELVICTDVLEHVEPECLDAVLEHLKALATRALFICVATRIGSRRLPDGRPAHVNVKPGGYWLEKLEATFENPLEVVMRPGEVSALYIVA